MLVGKDYRPLKKMGLSIRKSMDSLVEYWLLDQLSNQGRPMLEKNFALNITASLSGNPFSFDELIKESKDLFEREGVPGFIRVLLVFIDQFVITHWYHRHGKECCSNPNLRRAGRKSKNILSTIGTIAFEWTLLRCSSCGKIHSPLKDFFNMGTYQKKSDELEKVCLEVVSEDSYRKSVGKITNLTPVRFNHRTLHRWVMRTEATEIKVTHSDLNVLMADGTKFKKFINHSKELNKKLLCEKLGQTYKEPTNRGEVKIIIGINDKNEVVPLGAWTSESWKVIGNAIYRANNPDRRLAPVKVANTLVVDGEIALGRGLKNLVFHKQRCQWHVPHDLAPLMKYQDGAATEDINHAMDKVSQIFEVEIPKKDFEEVSTEDLVQINQKIKDCEAEIKKLTEYLSSKGYSQAATYLSNARDDLFTYLRYWMKTGVVTPRVTSKLERLMREINRRIKKFAFNWSDKGAARMTRLIIKLICSPKDWEDYLTERMRLSGNIKLTFAGIS